MLIGNRQESRAGGYLFKAMLPIFINTKFIKVKLRRGCFKWFNLNIMFLYVRVAGLMVSKKVFVILRTQLGL